jgi:predicted nucleic acid-binding protein
VILVDTSVWIDHLKVGELSLVRLLDRGEVLTHPFVIGELALGNLSQRDVVLGSMQNLPRAIRASDLEVMRMIEATPLFGLGIGLVDANLLASARLTPDALIWTRDNRLSSAAEKLGLLFRPLGGVA